MGRSGVTYDDVAAAADALALPNKKPTLAEVRTKLGSKGSFTTIGKHFRDWDDNRPKIAPAPIELPPELIQTMNKWALQTATTARAVSEEGLARARKENEDLMHAIEVVELERDVLVEQASSLKTERDQEQATALARAAEIERLTSEIARERGMAGQAQITAAEAQLRAQSQVEHLADLKASVQQLTEKVEAERQARIDAEKKAAVLEAKLNSGQNEAEEERNRIVGLQRHLDAAHQKADQMRAEYEQRLAEAAQMIAVERTAAVQERSAAHAVAIENATLKAQAVVKKKEKPAVKHQIKPVTDIPKVEA